MPYEIITIPFNITAESFYTDELNGFCINKNVLKTQTVFFKAENKAYWTVFIEYETIMEHAGKKTVNLTEKGKLCYERLRQWRKETAEYEGIPPFVIAKNSHFIEIIKKEIKSLEALKQINGFGKKKIEKYGKAIIEIIRAFYDISDER